MAATPLPRPDTFTGVVQKVPQVCPSPNSP
jgi:hypothetical protein